MSTRGLERCAYGLTQEERDAIGYIDFHKDNEGEADDDDD